MEPSPSFPSPALLPGDGTSYQTAEDISHTSGIERIESTSNGQAFSITLPQDQALSFNLVPVRTTPNGTAIGYSLLDPMHFGASVPTREDGKQWIGDPATMRVSRVATADGMFRYEVFIHGPEAEQRGAIITRWGSVNRYTMVRPAAISAAAAIPLPADSIPPSDRALPDSAAALPTPPVAVPSPEEPPLPRAPAPRPIAPSAPPVSSQPRVTSDSPILPTAPAASVDNAVLLSVQPSSVQPSTVQPASVQPLNAQPAAKAVQYAPLAPSAPRSIAPPPVDPVTTGIPQAEALEEPWMIERTVFDRIDTAQTPTSPKDGLVGYGDLVAIRNDPAFYSAHRGLIDRWMQAAEVAKQAGVPTSLLLFTRDDLYRLSDWGGNGEQPTRTWNSYPFLAGSQKSIFATKDSLTAFRGAILGNQIPDQQRFAALANSLLSRFGTDPRLPNDAKLTEGAVIALLR